MDGAEPADPALSSSGSPHYIRSRIGNACDGCKARKVKCDGLLPCTYCARRQRAHTCHYTPQRRRRARASAATAITAASTPSASAAVASPASTSRRLSRRNNIVAGSRSAIASPSRTDSGGVTYSRHDSPEVRPRTAASSPVGAGHTIHTAPATPRRRSSPSPALRNARASAEEETVVPREARLVCDAQGKLIFIGDCAPLSFFQSVRQLITTTSGVAHDAFAPQTSRYSVLENATAPASAPMAAQHSGSRRVYGAGAGPPRLSGVNVAAAVARYLDATTGLVDVFDQERLLEDLHIWASLEQRRHHNHHHSAHHHDNHSFFDDDDGMSSTVNYLVLAIGLQPTDKPTSQALFEYARDRATSSLGGNLGVPTVQAFLLITVFMLCSCQINGAFLFFGIGVRAAYSIGLHRTEVNARFGADVKRRRDRLWKSLRIVDLFLSTSMGRPPATSDVDCTVPYGDADAAANNPSNTTDAAAASRVSGADEPFDLLNASVQILLIVESIVVQIYSRKKISLQLTEGISRQLRGWSTRWLRPLKDVMATGRGPAASGACQVISSYYYAVMLVSRPFFMYELCRRLDDKREDSSSGGRSKLADACVDAAGLMVESVMDSMERGVLNGAAPLLVSWLFASSLVLGVGLLGGFGRLLEKDTRRSIQALDHLSRHDTHATQYSLIAQSLLTTAVEHLEKQEAQERISRAASSSQLFGLRPDSPIHSRKGRGLDNGARTDVAMGMQTGGDASMMQTPTGTGSLDGNAFLGLSEPMLQMPDDDGYWAGGMLGDEGTLNLFPLLDAGGGIDLVHYL